MAKSSKKSKAKVKKTILKDVTLKNNKLPLKTMLWTFLAFIGISSILYFQTITYDYVLDDKIVYTENTYALQGLKGIPSILKTESFVGYFQTQKDLVSGARYRPLSIVSFAIENSIFGVNSKVSHIINILLYGMCGFLVFLGITRLIGIKEKWYLSIAFLATLLWMIHPLHIEAVANVKGRDEILSLVFSMLTLILSIDYYDKIKISVGHLIGVFLMFTIGLFTKENTLTFFAIIPLSIYFFRIFNFKKVLPLMLALGAATALYLTIRISVIGYLFSGEEITDIMNNPFYNLDANYKYGMISYVLGKYVLLSYVPFPLTHDYYPWQIPKVGIGSVYSVLSLIFHIGLGVIALIGFKKKKIWSYLILFYFITLSIYSNIFFTIGTTMNDRFLFTSTIAISLSVVYFINWLSQKVKIPYLKFILLAVIVIPYLIISYNRVPAWKNAVSLNKAAVEVSKNSARANMFYGTALYNDQKKYTEPDYRLDELAKANKYVDRSLEILPIYFNANKMKAGIAAEEYQLTRDIDKLLANFVPVASLRPDVVFLDQYYDYLDGSGNDEKLVNYFNKVVDEGLLPRNNFKYAKAYLDRALKIRPTNPISNFLMGTMYQRQNHMSLAQKYFNIAEQYDPNIRQKVNK